MAKYGVLRQGMMLVVALVTLAANSSAQVSGGEGGSDWTVQLVPQGQTTATYPTFVNGSVVMKTTTRGWNVPAPNAPFSDTEYVENAVAGTVPYRVEVESHGTIHVKMTWNSQERQPPVTLYVYMLGSATYGFGKGAVGPGGADNGLGHETVQSGTNTSVSGNSTGARHARKSVVNGVVEFDITMEAHASGIGYKLANAWQTLSFSVLPGTRAVHLRARGLETTYYRDANGLPIENKEDSAGNMWGDTAVTQLIKDNYDYQRNVPLYRAPFSFTIERVLEGPWHSDPSDLLNEWWRAYPSDHIRDSLFSEITWLPTSHQFNDVGGQLIPVQSIKNAPYLNVIRYRATDQIDNFVAETLFMMRIHVPCELTGEKWRPDYQGDLAKCPEPIGDFRPLLLGSTLNGTNEPLVWNLEVTSSKTYTFTSGNAVNGGIDIDLEAIKLQLGLDSSHSTSEETSYSIGNTVQITVPAHAERFVYVHALGAARFDIGSKYAPLGFEGDGNLYKSDYQGFMLGVYPSQLF